MKYEFFKQEVIEGLERITGGCVTNHKIKKNNGIVLDSITIQKKSSSVAPTIYLEYFYEDFQNGKKVDDIVEEIIELVERNKEESLGDVVKEFLCFEKIKDRISYKLVNYEKNEQNLKNMPYRKFMDLAVVYQVVEFSESGRMATILINNHHLKIWNKTENELYAIANENSSKLLPPQIKSMTEMLFDMELAIGLEQQELKEMLDEDGDVAPMYVLTNRYKNFGATCILYEGILESIAKWLNKDFYILPSSVHEIIIVPDEGKSDAAYYRQIVKEVNATQVLEEEFLADSVYVYRVNEGIKVM